MRLRLECALLLGGLSACASTPVVAPTPPPVRPAPVVEVETSTDTWANEPLEQPWWGEGAPTVSLLVDTSSTGPSFSLPQSEDETVQAWVDLLTGRGRRLFRIWLARSSRYVPMFFEVLDRHGLPRDLVFLAMVESGFSPKAHSWASASGPWQFMPVTARRYGLRVGFWVDERRDFEKSTEAAARHLTWLYSVFEDWHLAMAAYNAGAGRVKGVLKRRPEASFWQLQRSRRLRRETKQYVPKILAAARVSKSPALHGFDDVPYLPPLRFSSFEVADATDLRTVAEACGGLPANVLLDLNPSLRVGVTPPGESWSVRVPEGLAESCRAGLSAIPAERRWTFRYHEPPEGEGVEAIAAAYQTSVEAILRFHELDDPARLADYAELVVPIPVAASASVAITAPASRRSRGAAYGPGKARLVFHRVRPGESLWKVSRRYGVSIRQIEGWNGLGSIDLQIGQKLRLYVEPDGRKGEKERARPTLTEKERSERAARKAALLAHGTLEHVVAEGESLWIIAQKYRSSVNALLLINDLRARDVLPVGETVLVPRPR